MVDMLQEQEVDLVETTHRTGQFESLTLRTSPTHWYCAAEFSLQRGEPVPLVLLDDPSPFRDIVLATLNAANVPWRLRLCGLHLACGSRSGESGAWRHGTSG
ncbi:DNA-binding transcriptional repressor LrhA [Leclercia adecarboxylata]|uniref:DNA-binding transcriptional repressor LrhA n=1 Tax=Leclercia adecarboxylata TaxID=83655 RepID=A0A4U9I843_9ENTR|nr:DNA-binding transcriptional repressor LrhA [Leclercia adecarboxylata]